MSIVDILLLQQIARHLHIYIDAHTSVHGDICPYGIMMHSVTVYKYIYITVCNSV